VFQDVKPGMSGYEVVPEEPGSSAENIAKEKHQHSHGHSHSADSQHEPLTATSGFLALVALSIHAVTEGLAIGLQSSTPNVFFLLAAVIKILQFENLNDNICK